MDWLKKIMGKIGIDARPEMRLHGERMLHEDTTRVWDLSGATVTAWLDRVTTIREVEGMLEPYEALRSALAAVSERSHNEV